MPWTTTCPRLSTTRAVKSSDPADEPALTTTKSCSASAETTALRIISKSSGSGAKRLTTQPHSSAIAPSTTELYSTMSPG